MKKFKGLKLNFNSPEEASQKTWSISSLNRNAGKYSKKYVNNSKLEIKSLSKAIKTTKINLKNSSKALKTAKNLLLIKLMSLMMKPSSTCPAMKKNPVAQLILIKCESTKLTSTLKA